MPLRSYATPEAVKQALEKRLRVAAGGSGMGRFRQVLVFDASSLDDAAFRDRALAMVLEDAAASAGRVVALFESVSVLGDSDQ